MYCLELTYCKKKMISIMQKYSVAKIAENQTVLEVWTDVSPQIFDSRTIQTMWNSL